ncbi:Hypothetical_protein [Hexamita inflata]|uniref:Hypothetical_protein n=1 Tax=Hexamita inflata TaxID=28002 RepID=A0AA86PWY7_9EUKA|nr:Hypothetical protein HINF_LOCUS16027 [Hexamita inflata]CAI9942800.1 Hypothetical protein HINF_LOCUS30445 [Hexamita inflata]
MHIQSQNFPEYNTSQNYEIELSMQEYESTDTDSDYSVEELMKIEHLTFMIRQSINNLDVDYVLEQVGKLELLISIHVKINKNTLSRHVDSQVVRIITTVSNVYILVILLKLEHQHQMD